MNKLHEDLVKQNWKTLQTAFLVLVQVESEDHSFTHLDGLQLCQNKT